MSRSPNNITNNIYEALSTKTTSPPSDNKSSTPAEITQETPTTFHYAVLQETSGEECESWYYFLRYEGNEKALKHLVDQLNTVNWYIYDNLSTFDLELTHLVSETTAREMTNVDLNSYSFHRKFDGKLETVDLKLKEKYNNEKKMLKVFEVLGYGKIENFIDQEDVDMTGHENDEEDSTSTSEEEEETTSGEDEDEKEVEPKKEPKKVRALPGVVTGTITKKIDIPRVAQAKQNKNKGKKKQKK